MRNKDRLHRWDEIEPEPEFPARLAWLCVLLSLPAIGAVLLLR